MVNYIIVMQCKQVNYIQQVGEVETEQMIMDG